MKKVINSFKIEELDSFPAKENPFNHDFYHMGMDLGINCCIMLENHSSEECKYFIVVNKETGKRIRITL